VGIHYYGVRASLSADAGAAGESFWLSDSTQTEHGFMSIVAGPNGAFDAIWLDGRETAHDGPMTLRRQVDRDSNAANMSLIEVCDCCQTSAVRAGDGSSW
jgi:hypothetical protein